MIENEPKFYGQECQDDATTIAFRKLHESIVNQVIDFCKTYGVEIDEFFLSADGLRSSIEYDEWVPCTDSSFSMYRYEEKDCDLLDKVEKKPYLWSI